MKKIILVFSLLISFIAFSQEKEENKFKYQQDIGKKHEIKLNAFNLIALSALDVSYEKLISPNSSYGVALFYNFSDLEDDIVFDKRFSLTPFYRWFFSETRYARGFFVEGFGMLNTYNEDYYDFDHNNNTSKHVSNNQTAFALGISVGGKFVTKQGFTTEVYLGIGRNLIKSDNDDDFFDTDVVGRFGISLGYRF